MAEDKATTLHSFNFPAVAAKIAERLQRLLQWIPPKARLSVCAGSVVLIVFALYMYLWGGSSVLNLVCQHSLKSADLTVIVDGNRNFSPQLASFVPKPWAAAVLSWLQW
jgi:cell division septal protein FtsQ